MKRRRKSKRMRTLRLWTWSEVTKAVPYLRSIIGSLREHYVTLAQRAAQIDRVAAHKAPPKREQIIADQTRADERARAQGQFDEALEELNGIDVFLLDPVKGLALIPFRKENELAWYVFDLFAPLGILGWRLHSDPIAECRPLKLLADATVGDSTIQS